jgi:prophage regulatory protein
MANKVLRRQDVQMMTGLSRSSIYDWMSKGFFPKQVNLGNRSVGWLESEINDWIDQRVQVSREKGGTSVCK